MDLLYNLCVLSRLSSLCLSLTDIPIHKFHRLDMTLAVGKPKQTNKHHKTLSRFMEETSVKARNTCNHFPPVIMFFYTWNMKRFNLPETINTASIGENLHVLEVIGKS